MPPRRQRRRAPEEPAAGLPNRDADDLRRQIELLTQRLDALTDANHADDATVSDENPFFEEHRTPSPERHARRWENGFKVDIPAFDGGLEADEFLDWLAQVEEILDFKEVPDDRRVPLVTIRLQGRAQAWWQQLKKNRVRQGKTKLATWDKFTRQLKAAFLPYNYERALYQRFQVLRQGPRFVDEYTTDIYQFLARTDLNETPTQLVSRYIGGLRLQFQDVLNMFDPLTVAEAHQRALQAEKQLARRVPTGSRQSSVSTGNSPTPPARSSTEQAPPAARGFSGPAQGRSGGGLRCFNCGELGHRQSECRKAPSGTRGLFADAPEDDSPPILSDPIYDDDTADIADEYVSGDVGSPSYDAPDLFDSSCA